jgi:hypothetical protein
MKTDEISWTKIVIVKILQEPGMVVLIYNLSTQEAEAGRLQVQEQLGLHSEALSNQQTDDSRIKCSGKHSGSSL